MTHRYSLRSQKNPGDRSDDTDKKHVESSRMYPRIGIHNRQISVDSSDGTEEEDQFTEEEDASFASPSSRKSKDMNRSHGSNVSYSDSSFLSTTASDSFSFHHPDSPKAESSSRQGNKLYPKLKDVAESSSRQGNKLYPKLKDESLNPVRDKRKQKDAYAVSPEASKQHKHQTTGFQSGLSSNRLVFVVVAVIIFAVAVRLAVTFLYNRQNKSIQSNGENDKFSTFCNKIEEKAEQFQAQNSRLWKVVKSSVYHVMQPEESSYPAVLLLAAERGNIFLASDLAEAVATDFITVMQTSTGPSKDMPLSLNISQKLAGLESGEQKKELDNWLRNRFEQAPTAAVLHHLEILKTDAALLLHGYCDGDNAPYKNVLLILLVYMDDMPENDRNVELFLSSVWTNEHSLDKVDALLSRIANNIGIITTRS